MQREKRKQEVVHSLRRMKWGVTKKMDIKENKHGGNHREDNKYEKPKTHTKFVDRCSKIVKPRSFNKKSVNMSLQCQYCDLASNNKSNLNQHLKL